MSIVIVDRLAPFSDALDGLLSRSVVQLGLVDQFNQADAILIKPNLTYPTYRAGVTTRREFVEGLVRTLRRINSSTAIYIGEGEGGYNSYSMSAAMVSMGYKELATRFPNVHIVNLSRQETREVELNANGKKYPIHLPEIFFEKIDFSISCPLPKVHCMTGVTLSLKNQWGCLPDAMRLRNHYVFDELIGQVCDKLKFRFAFLDGRYGLDDNGPMVGTPIEVGWFVAADSLGAFDVVVAEMMGVDWRSIRHFRTAHEMGYIPDRDDIHVIGRPESLRRQFRLRRTFWNYPALIAFHSKWLTDFVYLSRWAKLVHSIMYTFRKRPIPE